VTTFFLIVNFAPFGHSRESALGGGNPGIALVKSGAIGLQTPSLSHIKYGINSSRELLMNWVPVFKGNPGFRIKCGMTGKDRKRCYFYKGANIMRIAISTDGDSVSAHFGRCPSFTIIDIEDGKITKKEVLENPGHQPGLIPRFPHQRGVECIVAGGMGMRAQGFFAEAGIQTILGASGKINDVIESLQKGTLESGESLCKPGVGKGHGIDKTQCDHPHHDHSKHDKCKH